MKRSWRLLLSLLAALALVASACGSDSASDGAADAGSDDTEAEGSDDEGSMDEGSMESDLKVALVFDIGGRGDQSFNDSAAAGYDKAQGEIGFEGQELQANPAGDDRDELLDLAASQGANLIVGNGFLFEDAIEVNAAAYPEVFFAITDGSLSDADFAPYDLDNVTELGFAEHEGSFLVGAAAAKNSTSGTIGFIGGVSIPSIQKFEAGYVAGAKHINPDIEVIVNYLTQPPDFSGFNDPAKGKEAGNAMYDNGADVVYHAAGGSGSGLFQAADEKSDELGSHLWAIGVDSDQYLTAGDLQDHVLTSMIKRVDVAIESTINDVNDGTFQSGNRLFDLSVDGVGYSTSGGFVDDIAADLEALKADIISGAISVPEAP